MKKEIWTDRRVDVILVELALVATVSYASSPLLKHQEDFAIVQCQCLAFKPSKIGHNNLKLSAQSQILEHEIYAPLS